MVSRGGRRINIERIGIRKRHFGDLYHQMLETTWAQLLGLFVLLYVAGNTLFAALYMLEPGAIQNARLGSFADSFYFSVQTMATIGYGQMVPQTTYAHLLVATEALTGLLGTAMATGLMFAKFSRPSARVMFGKTATVTLRDGVPSLMFRMANTRGNQIVDANLKVVFARTEVTREGEEIRRLYDLKLVRHHMVSFTLTWTAVHPINADSPLYGQSSDSLMASQSELIVSLVGIDETMSQTVHVRWSYIGDEIQWGARLRDVILRAPDGHRYVDYSFFHDVVPDPAAPPGADLGTVDSAVVET